MRSSSPSRRFAAGLLVAVMMAPVIGAGQGNQEGTGPQKPPYYMDESQLPFTPLAGATASWGVHKNAAYRMEVPETWNGGLVLYHHGVRGDCVEPLPGNPPGDPCNLAAAASGPSTAFRNVIITRGFAWAASGFSTAGRDISQAARDSKNLAELFADNFGEPNRKLLTGFSLGGGVTTLMAEQWPYQFDGALAMCAVANYPQLLDITHLGYQVVAATLAGQEANVTFPMAEGVDFVTDVVPSIRTALGFSFNEALPVVLTDPGKDFRAAVEMLSGGPRAVKAGDIRNLFDLSFWAWFRNNFVFSSFRDVRTYDLAPGNISGNADTVYQLDTNPELSAKELDLNARVPRDPYDINSRHTQGMSGLPSTNGDLHVKMINMHELGDLFVPFELQRSYARMVAANGKSHNLVTRAIREYLHCGFTLGEVTEAFDDLVEWVETGVKPASDDVLDDAVVAHEQFGCQFTRGLHGINANTRPIACQ